MGGLLALCSGVSRHTKRLTPQPAAYLERHAHAPCTRTAAAFLSFNCSASSWGDGQPLGCVSLFTAAALVLAAFTGDVRPLLPAAAAAAVVVAVVVVAVVAAPRDATELRLADAPCMR